MSRRKKVVVNEPQGDATDTYLHAGHERPILPAANETSDVHEAEPPADYIIDPHDIPRLKWFNKGEDVVEVPTFTIHQHEAVNPMRILKATFEDDRQEYIQEEMFEQTEADRRRLRTEEVYSYNHTMQWTNRMIAGDSLLVMNALLQHERLAGQVQCIYMDPPYGIKFGSNFMPTIHKRDVKDGKDEDMTAEPGMVTAFRDTWKWGIHSYLTYLRDRFILMRELLAPSGSIFVQISMENVHRVRCLLDEVFGPDNCVSMITYSTTSALESSSLDRAGDYILWYAKDREQVKYHQLYKDKLFGGEGGEKYRKIELPNGKRITIREWEKELGRPVSDADLKQSGCRACRLADLTSQGSASEVQPFEFGGKTYYPGNGRHWMANYPEGMKRLVAANRVEVEGNSLSYIRYFDDFPVMKITNIWNDVGGIQSRTDRKVYVVQTSREVIQRCILMTTEPGDLVLDPTCGSGTTAVVAEEWGRRWITIDTSRVALALAKRRLITQVYPWYKLADEGLGVDGGLVYKTVPHVMLGDIANGVPSKEETLWDRPLVEKGKVRVTGPFTVEALPEPVIEPLEEKPEDGMAAGKSLEEWVAELRTAGIQSASGQERLRFSALEVSGTYTWFHAQGVTTDGTEALVCMGSASAPLSPTIVRNALDEAADLYPRPGLIVFAAFQFTAEAEALIAGCKVKDAQVLPVQMNTDLQMTDLLKRQARNQSFILVGQPDVQLKMGVDGRLTVKVLGFDYYDPVKQAMVTGSPKNIAMWMVDGNYDGRCVNPQQCFFPGTDVWKKLESTLKGTIVPMRLKAYQGTKSLPFKPGENLKVAVKIIDDKGFESIRVFPLTADGRPRGEAAR